MESIDESLFDVEVDRRGTPACKVHSSTLEDKECTFIATVADMDFMIPPVVQDALQSRLNHGIFGYELQPSELLPAVVAWLKCRHDWEVDSTHILSAPSVVNTLAIAAALFSSDGDAIIIQPPVFVDFSNITHENRRQIITNPLQLREGRYCMDFDDLEQKAAMENAKILFLCNPQNPIGRMWTAEELRRVGDICLRHSVLVVSDEMHSDMIHYGNTHTPIASLEQSFAMNSITCISPGKTFNIASCCSSFAIVPADAMRERMRAEGSRLGVAKQNALANVAMVAAYQSGGEWLNCAQSYIQRNIDLVRSELQGIGGVQLIEPQATFLLWLDCRELNMTPKALNAFLKREAKWAVVGGEVYGELGEGFVRVNVACPRARMREAMKQLAGAIKMYNTQQETTRRE
jgi:cysteine-S-conjugate beta-lyase